MSTDVRITLSVGVLLRKHQLASMPAHPELSVCCKEGKAKLKRAGIVARHCPSCGGLYPPENDYVLTDLGVRLGLPKKECEWRELVCMHNANSFFVAEWDEGRPLYSGHKPDAWVFGVSLGEAYAIHPSGALPVVDTFLLDQSIRTVLGKFKNIGAPMEPSCVGLYTHVYVG